MILAVANNKGGVAKTTTAANLASKLSENHTVLLVDIDPQGNLADFFGLRSKVFDSRNTPDGLCISNLLTGKATLKQSIIPADRSADGVPRPNLYLIPASRELEYTAEELLVQDFVGRRSKRGQIPIDDILEHYLSPAVKAFDFIIIDCPPKLDTLKLAVYRFANYVIVPVKTDHISVTGAVQHTKDLAELRSTGDVSAELAFIVPTMHDGRQILAQQMLDGLIDTYGPGAVTAPVPQSVKVKESPAAGGRSLFEYAPRSAPADAYLDLVQRVRALA